MGGGRKGEKETESLEWTVVVILYWILVYAFNLVFFMYCICSK